MSNLAIVIPFYRKTFFKETLNSLSLQSDKRFKVYIGDDASPENSENLLKQYKNQIDFQYLKFKKNLGTKSLVKHWKRCIAMTENEDWILILGDDDVLSNNFVEVFYKNIDEIEKHKNNVVRFSTKVIDENSKELYNNSCKNRYIKSSDAFYQKITDQSRASLSEHVFRRSAYDKYGFRDYKLAWHSDDMACLEYSNFKDIYCISEAFVSIRVSGSSLSGKTSNLTEKNKASHDFYLEIIKDHLNKFDSQQKNLLIRMFERNYILNNGKSMNAYIAISKLFIENHFFLSFFRFTFRFLFKK